jgi:hypothetical protein
LVPKKNAKGVPFDVFFGEKKNLFFRVFYETKVVGNHKLMIKGTFIFLISHTVQKLQSNITWLSDVKKIKKNGVATKFALAKL